MTQITNPSTQKMHLISNITEISESAKFDFLESTEVDGIHVLAKVSGPAFFPDSVSENNVRYTREFWETILSDEEVNTKLADKVMFGTIGHQIVDINDSKLLAGVASHITTKMWIDDSTGIGMAEHLVLNTNAGKILNTVLRAGSKLRVSTRGQGELRKSKDGVNDIDEYYFQRIDFVINPGYREALPSVVESLNSVSDNNKQEDNSLMADQTNDKVVEILQKQIDDLKQQQDKVLNEKAEISERLRKVSEELDNVKSEKDNVANQLDKYEEMGTVEEISEAIDEASERIKILRNTVEQNAQDTAQTTESVTELQKQLDDAKEELEQAQFYRDWETDRKSVV